MNFRYALQAIAITSCLFLLSHVAAEAAGMPNRLSLHGEGSESLIQQDPPGSDQNRKITVSVDRSIQNETVKLLVVFPKDADEVKVSLHNLLGRQISVHPATSAPEGESSFEFDTHSLPNGPYFIVLEALGQRITKKIMLTR